MFLLLVEDEMPDGFSVRCYGRLRKDVRSTASSMPRLPEHEIPSLEENRTEWLV